MEKSSKPVVICDLDGTLVHENTMRLQVRQAIRNSKLNILRLALCLPRGKVHFKKKLTEFAPTLAQNPVPNPAIIQLLKQYRKEHYEIHLVSASEHRFVSYLGPKLFTFDGIFGSTDVNIKGKAKAIFLVRIFGDGGFMYIGDSKSDIHVWRSASSGIAVSPSAKTLRKIQDEFLNVRTL